VKGTGEKRWEKKKKKKKNGDGVRGGWVDGAREVELQPNHAMDGLNRAYSVSDLRHLIKWCPEYSVGYRVVGRVFTWTLVW
jgi:hypothetical protein